jgi:hypothetical protein
MRRVRVKSTLSSFAPVPHRRGQIRCSFKLQCERMACICKVPPPERLPQPKRKGICSLGCSRVKMQWAEAEGEEGGVLSPQVLTPCPTLLLTPPLKHSAACCTVRCIFVHRVSIT